MAYRLRIGVNRIVPTDLVLLFILAVTGLVAVFNALAGYPVIGNNIVAALSLALSIYLCYIYRFNIGLFLVMVFIFYTNYSVVIGVYLMPSIRPEFLYHQFATNATFGRGITCIFIFELITLLLSRKAMKDPRSIELKSEVFIDNFEYNSLIAIGAPIIYMIIFIMFFRIGIGNARGGSSSINEYRTIILIIGSYYCGRKKVYKYIWTVIVAITSVLILISGNRVDMFGSMIFLIFFWYANLLDYKKLMVLLPAIVVVLTTVGILRGSMSLETMDFGATVQTLLGDSLTFDGAIYAYGPSLAIIELAERTSISEKFDLFVRHIAYIFTMGVVGNSNPDLSNWSRNYYIHYWGCVSPTYFYFWFGYFGALLYSVLVNTYNKILQVNVRRKATKFVEKAGYILSLYFVSNVARWYMYGPMGLLRSMFVCFVIFCIVYAFDTVTRRKTS